MKTRQEIEKLKAEWREDQGWDLADTEDFEEHAAELGAYQAQVEAEQRAEAAREHEAGIARLLAPALSILPMAPNLSASLSDDARERVMAAVGPTREMASTAGSTMNLILRMVAEMVLPLQRRLERQAGEISNMQLKHDDELEDLQDKLDALRAKIKGSK